MKVSSISVNQHYQSKKLSNLNHQKHSFKPTFEGAKGAGIGAGVGLLWGGAIVAICAVGAPYLLPAIAADALIGGAGAGALAGHCIENDNKKDK